MSDSTHTLIRVARILSAIILFAIAGIHLFLVFDGVGGVLGILFVLNAIAGVALGIGMLALRGRPLQLAAVLSLLFIVASFASLVLALTVGLFGITETWSFTLVPQTFVIEAVGIPVLAATSVLVARRRKAA